MIVMDRRTFLLTGTAGVLPALAHLQAAEESDEVKRLRAATTAFGEIMSAGDKSIPNAILEKAQAIAIFPGTKKGGLGLGAMHGRGVISVRNGGVWSAPSFMALDGGSIGFQIGFQSADIVLVMMQRKGVETLLKNQFKLGADASVAAGPVGRDAQASTDLQMRAEILSYSRARYLFAGVSINGSSVRVDADANQRFYGQRISVDDIVFANKAPSRPPVPDWLAALNRYAK